MVLILQEAEEREVWEREADDRRRVVDRAEDGRGRLMKSTADCTDDSRDRLKETLCKPAEATGVNARQRSEPAQRTHPSAWRSDEKVSAVRSIARRERNRDD
jgi:hypothetical protein